MKKNLVFLAMFLFGTFALTFTSCDKEEDEPQVIDNPVYGFQIQGTATGDKVFTIDQQQMVEPSSDFAVKVTREGMLYGIYFLTTGDFAFKNVTVSGTTTYSAANVAEATQEAEAGEAFTYKKGDLVEGGTDVFSVTEEGLYYILTDETTKKFFLVKINNFEINATGDKATLVSANAEGATYEAKAVALRSVFKVRINTAWKLITEDIPWTNLDAGGADGDHCRPVLSYGGALDGLTGDGADIAVDNGGNLLDFTFTWNPAVKGIAGITVATKDAGELPPPDFPENLYMIGGSIGGWDWAANGIEMVPVHSNPHLFWRIVWMGVGADANGVKFSPEKDWGKDFGVDAAAGATNGVYAKGVDNVPAVATEGYYMVVVNLKEETIEVNPAMVYGINPVFGDADWAGGIEFTVDNANKVITSPAFTAAGDLRMYVKAATMTNADGAATDWWQSEFNVYSGKIEYRGTGNDQAANPVTAGQKVSLNFSDGTATIQ